MYSQLTYAIMNSSGVVAAMNVAGVNGHGYSYNEYVVQRNPDGTWGQPALVYTGPGLFAGDAGRSFSIVGLSKNNEILINDPTQPSGSVYNVSTHTLTSLEKSFFLLASGTCNRLRLTTTGGSGQRQGFLEPVKYRSKCGQPPALLQRD